MALLRKNIISALIFALCLLFNAGCIENDLPYPVVELQITSIEIEGVKSQPVIDEVTRTVSVELYEQTDIENVRISSVTYAFTYVCDIVALSGLYLADRG